MPPREWPEPEPNIIILFYHNLSIVIDNLWLAAIKLSIEYSLNRYEANWKMILLYYLTCIYVFIYYVLHYFHSSMVVWHRKKINSSSDSSL